MAFYYQYTKYKWLTCIFAIFIILHLANVERITIFSCFLVFHKWPNQRLGCLFNFRGPSRGCQKTEAFIPITVTSSRTLICFWQKYQESFKIAEYPLHQLICLAVYKSMLLFQLPTPKSESLLRVIMLPSLVYPYFEFDIKQFEIRKHSNKQKTEWIAPFC